MTHHLKEVEPQLALKNIQLLPTHQTTVRIEWVFIPVYCSQFCPPKGKLSVCPGLMFIHGYMEWTIHGPKLVGHVFYIHRSEHAVSIEIMVPTSLPQVNLESKESR